MLLVKAVMLDALCPPRRLRYEGVPSESLRRGSVVTSEALRKHGWRFNCFKPECTQRQLVEAWSCGCCGYQPRVKDRIPVLQVERTHQNPEDRTDRQRLLKYFALNHWRICTCGVISTAGIGHEAGRGRQRLTEFDKI